MLLNSILWPVAWAPMWKFASEWDNSMKSKANFHAEFAPHGSRGKSPQPVLR